MRHSIPSPKQHRRPLPSLLSESYSMAQGFHPSILRLTILHNDPAAPQEICPSRTPGTSYLSRLVWATTFNFFYTYLTYCTTNKLFELKFILCTISRLRRYHDSWKCGGSFEARQTTEAVVLRVRIRLLSPCDRSGQRGNPSNKTREKYLNNPGDDNVFFF